MQARDAGQRRHRLLPEEFAPHGSDFDLPGSWLATYLQYSMLGLVQVYNRLPACIVEANGCVSSFQAALQGVLAQRAAAGCSAWYCTFSPRFPCTATLCCRWLKWRDAPSPSPALHLVIFWALHHVILFWPTASCGIYGREDIDVASCPQQGGWDPMTAVHSVPSKARWDPMTAVVAQ